MKKVSLVFLLAAIPLCSMAENWKEIPLVKDQLALQTKGNLDCGPASIFNALSMGNNQLKASIQSLSGKSVQEKYLNFFNLVSQKPSEMYSGSGKMRTDPTNGGTEFADMRFILADAVDLAHTSNPQYYSGEFADRMDYEPYGDLAPRIQMDLKRSLSEGYPPIISRAMYKKQERLSAHYMMVFGVSDVTDSNDGPQFQIKVFDTRDGSTQIWQVSEVKRFFGARKDDLDSKSVTVFPKTNNSVLPDSPFLVVTPSDSEALKTGEAEALKRHYADRLILEQIFGRLDVPFMN